jgi:hypothetical protein
MAGIGGSFTNITNGLKRRFDQPFVNTITWSKSKLAAMILKTAGNGDKWTYGLAVGDSPNVSVDFATAQTLSQTNANTQLFQPQIDWFTEYGIGRISGKALRAANSDMGAMFGKFSGQLDGLMRGVMRGFSSKIYRAGYGCIGFVDASNNGGLGFAQTVIKLSKPEDVINFDKGMVLQAASGESTGALRSSGGTVTVASVQYQAGTVTCTGNLSSGIAALAAGDALFPKGNRQDSATPARTCIPGVLAWGPTTQITTTENFFNLDRSLDGRLQFTIIDATTGAYNGATEEEAIIGAVTEARRWGGQNHTVFINPTRMKNIILQGQARRRNVQVKGPLTLGFSAIAIEMPSGGEVVVVDDPFCPVDNIFGIDMKSFKYVGLGSNKLPEFIDDDGAGKILRISDDDGVESRVGYYGTTACNMPIGNFTIKMA